MKTAALLCLTTTTLAAAAPDYSAVIPIFEDAVREEMRAWQIEGLAVAWIDGQTVAYEAAFGEARKDSVFRAGSISKLFNAIGVMQLVEAGKLDLDAPIDPQVLPENPFPGAPAVTLRHLLSHRSGLQRESTVGSYFDASEPSLAATVASLRGSAIVTAPGAMTRYSNIAPSLAGHLLAQAAGVSFEQWQTERVLKPLGMTRSAWLRKDVPGGQVLGSHMRVADQRGGFTRRAAPLFDLGTIPAGNLYTTAGDLARFVAMLAADGNAPGGRILKSESLAAMWQPQFDEKGAFGLGFSLGKFREHQTVGHGGAVYGHSTGLTWLPQGKIGVVVLSNEDIVNGRIHRLERLALALMIQARSGVAPTAPTAFSPEADDLTALASAWESQSFWWELTIAGSALRGDFATQPCTLTPVAPDKFRLNSRMHDDETVTVERDATGQVAVLVAGAQRFTRAPAAPPKLPDAWRRFLGSYGPEFIPLVVHEKFGHLYVTTENMCDYRLTPLNRHVFKFGPGMYNQEHLVFLAPTDGPAPAVDFANMILPRLR
jgi:CubicO group peptidase (beta-lactamase class C family)